MSHQEPENQVDYVPDSEKIPDEKEPELSCAHCIHKKVCFFLTSLDQNRQAFEMSGVLTLPYSINILATTCKAFDNGKTLAENLTKEDNADEIIDDPELLEEEEV